MTIDIGGRGKPEPVPPFTELIRQTFYWRLNTRKASRALITLRFFESGTVVSVRSISESYYTFSGDFNYAFSVLCANFHLHPTETACYEEYFVKDWRLGFYCQKYIEFRLMDELIHREIISAKEFYLMVNQLRHG